MHILYISDYFLIEPNTILTGAHRRMEIFSEALAGIAQLDVLLYTPKDRKIFPNTLVDQERILSEQWNTQVNLFLCPGHSIPQWRQRWEGIFWFSRQAHFTIAGGVRQRQALETCLQRKPNAIFARRLHSICPLLQTQQSLPPVFFDMDDIEHIKLIRSIQEPNVRKQNQLYYLHLPALLWGEYQAVRLATRTFVCSEHDRAYLSKKWELPGVTVIPNAISIVEPQSSTTEPTLLLLGSYSYPPNSHAANFLVEQVFPLVQKEIPEAQLIIAGSAPENIRTYAKLPRGVEFTGFADDLNALYKRSRVVCCPIFSGGGTRVKMIEAAAYGKPIVATRIGAEGLEMVPDQDYLLRNTAADFADACVKLLRNDDLCDCLSRNARAAAIKHYDRINIVKLIQQEILSATW